MKIHTDTALLVVGFGNTLREDDGAGPRVVERLEALGLRGVNVISCPQLTPEAAEAVAHAEVVVFVDASTASDKGVELHPLSPDDSAQSVAHAAAPAKLLALARDAYGFAPPAWLLTIPGEHFGYGEEMSEKTRYGVETAVRHIARLAAEWVY